jgi:hypothetical protein
VREVGAERAVLFDDFALDGVDVDWSQQKVDARARAGDDTAAAYQQSDLPFNRRVGNGEF